jgi:hypothetical protein
MFADKNAVNKRRFHRKLKAAASILVAVAAGTFLACKRTEPAKVSTPDSGTQNNSASTGNTASAASAAPSATGTTSVAIVPSASGSSAPAASSSAAIVPAKPPTPPKPTVDRHQHRKGMPVIDNLLE